MPIPMPPASPPSYAPNSYDPDGPVSPGSGAPPTPDLEVTGPLLDPILPAELPVEPPPVADIEVDHSKAMPVKRLGAPKWAARTLVLSSTARMIAVPNTARVAVTIYATDPSNAVYIAAQPLDDGAISAIEMSTATGVVELSLATTGEVWAVSKSGGSVAVIITSY